MLNPRRAKEVVVPGTLHGVSRASTLFCFMYQVLFSTQATHQVKAISIAISEDNPLVEIGLSPSPMHLDVFVTLFTTVK